MEIGSASDNKQSAEIARTVILVFAVSATLFMVTDYASMAARFCYKVYALGVY
ncbi:hypothetical protein MPTK1_8g08880 [Marchantia polymorpha subsp. ruderalis]|nr:hypothetical protein Mp_8g08880 [Marchantia polymorpha subsp. ruderalis]